MRTLATKQPTHDSAKQNKGGSRVRSACSSASLSRSISPLSPGMPLLQRKCACGGGCPRCKKNLGIQTKLKIGEPGDKYEKEADRIADEVMRMPETSVQRQVEPEEEEEEMVQRKANISSISSVSQAKSEVPPLGNQASGDLESRLNPSQAGGSPLSEDVRGFMEPRFGADFSSVRVHTGTEADNLNQAIQARAFTTGRDIFFRKGEYNPGSYQGKELLAHELTHVVQHKGDRVQGKLAVNQPGDPYEREADHVAKAILQRPMEEGEAVMAKADNSSLHRLIEEEKKEPVLANLKKSRIYRKNDEEAEGAFKQRKIFFTDFETEEKRPFEKDTNWSTILWPAEDNSTFKLLFVGSYLELPKMDRGIGELGGHMSMKDFRDMNFDNETYYPRLDFKVVWNQTAPENPLNLGSSMPADYDPDGGGSTKGLVTYVYGGYTEHKYLGKISDHALYLTFVYSSDTSETSTGSLEVGGSYKGIEAKTGFSESVTVTRAAISWTWGMRFKTYG